MAQLPFDEPEKPPAGEKPSKSPAAGKSASKEPAADTRPKVLSVSAVNRLAKSLLEDNFPAIAVEGEISNFSAPASGHWYFTLKDRQAQLRCAMFAGRNRLLRKGFKPSNGVQVVVRGRLSIYEGRGDYQLIADKMEETGSGALQRAFEELKAKLQAEGLFEAEHKQEVEDIYFGHVGVITSATGAALRDIVSVFGRRFPALRLTLIPTPVQGKEAPAEIVRAIETANRLAERLGLEALIVGRGGGSPEDLQAFNEETVARAIFASELPVVSAVGHETDFTIADFTADLRAPTPSAAAELLSPDQDEFMAEFEDYLEQLAGIMERRLARAQERLVGLGRLMKRPDRRLQEQAQRLDNLDIRLQRAEAAARERRQGRLGGLSRSLQAVSPLQTLARGYSISFDEADRPVLDVSQAQPGSRLLTYLARGSITSTVETVDPDENALLKRMTDE